MMLEEQDDISQALLKNKNKEIEIKDLEIKKQKKQKTWIAAAGGVILLVAILR